MTVIAENFVKLTWIRVGSGRIRVGSGWIRVDPGAWLTFVSLPLDVANFLAVALTLVVAGPDLA